MSRGRRRSAAAAVAVVLAVSFGSASAQAAPQASWQPQTTPPIFGDAQLASSVALTSSDVWAVGQTRANPGGATEWRNVALHWDGGSWTRAITPDRETAPAQDFLTGVTGTATDDVWAVGHSARPAGSGGTATMVLHWDGQHWQFITSPDPATSDAFVAASSPRRGEVWAVGDKADPSVGAFVPMVQRYRNGTWHEIAYASPIAHCATADTELTSVDAVSGTDVYVGGTCVIQGHYRGVVAHWDGVQWTAAALGGRNTEITGLGGGRGGGEVWAVGDTVPYGSTSTLHGIAFHGAGQSFTAAPMPAVTGYLRTIYGVGVGPGPNAPVYAVGRTFKDASNYQGLIYRWTGSRWASEPIDSTNTELLYSAAVAPDGSAWAVGFHFGSTDQPSLLQRVVG